MLDVKERGKRIFKPFILEGDKNTESEDSSPAEIKPKRAQAVWEAVVSPVPAKLGSS